jgi:hypothetical protein
VNGGTGSVSFSSNTATLTGDGTNAASIYQAITTVSGYFYTVSVTNGSGNAVTVQAGTTAGGSTLLAASIAAVGATTTYEFIAQGTTSYVQINNTGATAANVTAMSVQSAGKLPTNWSNWGPAYGVNIKIIGTGTVNGINYVDMQLYGTPTGTNAINGLVESPTVITAANGQTWTTSVYLALEGGSTTNFNNLRILVGSFNSSGTGLATAGISFASSLNSTVTRYSTTQTISQADLPPLKWSSLKYVLTMEDEINGKEAAYG